MGDLTSSYDIIGPHFTSTQSVDMNFLLTCIFETVELFKFMVSKPVFLYVMGLHLIWLQSKPHMGMQALIQTRQIAKISLV